MFSQLVVAWRFLKQSIVAEQALADGTDEDAFYHAKIATANFYIDTILPTTHTIAEIIKSGERGALDYKEEWFRFSAAAGAMA